MPRSRETGADPSVGAWHALSGEDVLRRLDSRPSGLTGHEVAERLVRFGPNAFEAPRGVSALGVLLGQFRSIIVLLLLVALAIAIASGDTLDAGAIGTVLLLTVSIGFVTEYRARRAMEALLSLDVARALVLREGVPREIDARDVVPGDLLELEAGRLVPADCRLLDAVEFRTLEAALTGEPVPVEKRSDAALLADVPLPDRATMAYKATSAVAGHARAVAVATGMATEVGRIGTLAGSIRPERTPLERRLDELGRWLALAALVVAVAVLGLGMLQGLPFSQIVQTSIALAVAAVPEGLPVVGTIAMVIGVRRMARRHALIRRLPVVETLGSATVICSDKTGTLTAGEMVVTVLRLRELEVAVTGTGYAPVGTFRTGAGAADVTVLPPLRRALEVAALANRSDVVYGDGGWRMHGDPTEAALMAAARKAGLDPDALRRAWPEVAEIPFSSARMLMATFHRGPESLLACVKGAPGRVLDRCETVLTADGVRPLASEEREELAQLNEGLAARGLRVLALASGTVAATTDNALRGLTWVGLAGLSDPPAPGVTETIQAFQRAGIRTVMITGDQRLTAETVGRELGLLGPGRGVLDGRAMAHLDDAALVVAVGETDVFSRVSPTDKLRLVEALRSRGDVVAMLGDGVNDVPALRRADIGVAMGRRGTDMAKEAASVILTDDRFPTVAAAVEEGRVIFDNVRKFVFYLFSCNLAEILLVLGGGLAGLPAPLLPLQILWLNLVTDTFPALALAAEPGEPTVMREPPRDPRAGILSRPLILATVFYGLLIAAVSVVAFALGLATGGADRARTLAFMTLALAQILHLGTARRAGAIVDRREALGNPLAVGAVLLAILLQIVAVLVPGLSRVLRLTSLSSADWAVVVLLGVVPALVGQLIRRRRPGGRR